MKVNHTTKRNRMVIINYAAVARHIGCSRQMLQFVVTGKRKSKRIEGEIKTLLKIRSLKSIVQS